MNLEKTSENQGVINAILSIFNTKKRGPGQLFLSVFTILAIIIFIVAIPFTTIILNYNQVKNTNAIQENISNLSITENTLLTLQEYLQASNRRISELEHENDELLNEIAELKTKVLVLETTDLTDEEVDDLINKRLCSTIQLTPTPLPTLPEILSDVNGIETPSE